MSALEDLMAAALLATPARRLEALRLLRGETPLLEPQPAVAPREPYLTLQEVAAELQVNPTTLWRWRVPGHSFGGRLRYRLTEVEAYLRGNAFQRRTAALRAERRQPGSPLTSAASGPAGVNYSTRPVQTT